MKSSYLVGLVALLSVANAFASIPLVGALKVDRYVLDNGLRLLVVEDHSSPTFAYQTWFRVGSHDEVPKYTGLAHLFEHLMFKGTKNHPEGEFDRLLEAAGEEGENAFTSRDYTAYVQELPKDKLDLIAGLESDRMVGLIVNDASFKTEREVVQNERRFRNENSADGMMYQEIFSLAFDKHPYHWPVIGYAEDLARMKSQDALNFYHSYYSPNHATIIVAGDVKANDVFDLVKKYYGAIPSQVVPAHKIPIDPPATHLKSKKLKLNIQVEKLVMGYHVPGITHEDAPALILLESVLSGGKSARLNRALVDSGIATSVDTYDLDEKDPTLFITIANMQKGRHATEAEKVILQELAKLAKSLVSDVELTRAKNKIDFSFYESFDTNNERAHFLGKYEALAGDFEAGMRGQKKIDALTPIEIQSVVKKYFNPKTRVTVLGVPK